MSNKRITLKAMCQELEMEESDAITHIIEQPFNVGKALFKQLQSPSQSHFLNVLQMNGNLSQYNLFHSHL